jgi:alcohol dehydrogenase class IV
MFGFGLPTRIEFGNGVSSRVAQEAATLAATRVLVITDRGVRAAGLVEPLVERLQTHGLVTAVFDEVAPNPRALSVASGAAAARDHGADVLVAIGGGSPMDTAKGIGAVLTHGGDILEYEGYDRLTKPITPLIVLPTTAGSGSEATYVAVVTDPARSLKAVIESQFLAARVALVDPALTVGLPRALTASTGMDALAHAIEAYVSPCGSPISDSLALTAISLIARSLGPAYANGEDMVARNEVMLASLMAGIAVNNSSTGGAHAMAEAAAGLYDLPHGVANAIYLPIMMEYNSLGLPDKFTRIAEAMGEDVRGLSRREAALAAASALRRLARDVHIPTAEQVGVRPEDLPRLAAEASGDVSAKNNPRILTEADLLSLYLEAQ